MIRRRGFFLISALLLGSAAAQAAGGGAGAFAEAQKYYRDGQYFAAARYAYAASQDGADAGEANAIVTLSLAKAQLYQSSVYFFIKTLESGNRTAIRRVLTITDVILARIGPDVLREYLVKATRYEDYDAVNRSAYLFSLGKAAILKDDLNKAIEYLNQVRPESRLFPYGLQLRGTALAIQGRNDEAIDDFRDCQKYADLVVTERDSESQRLRSQQSEARDLRARCSAGEARVYYQNNRFEDADRAYDRIPKASLVWPDILFEQAWNAYAKREFNRTLGKLVTYKSPALQFAFNPEIDILRAQSFLSLCLYDDTEKTLDEFDKSYTDTGREVKRFVEQNAGNLEAFYQLGLATLGEKFANPDPVKRLVNRFIRGPYFANLAYQDKGLEKERAAIGQLSRLAKGNPNAGLAAFLGEVLKWRRKSIRTLGGAFVKNSLIDYHTDLVAQFEKEAFIRLEMLSRAKDKLVRKTQVSSAEAEERKRGNVRPGIRDSQMYWSFNGEFWNDELGDYVFGLESQCAN